jgi:ribonuclease PH
MWYLCFCHSVSVVLKNPSFVQAEYQKQLQEECESKVVALETAEVLKTQEISELQTRFKCQEAHLQDLLEQEHRKISEMLTKQEELHTLKDALRE